MNFDQILAKSFDSSPLSSQELILNLVIGAILALITRYHFFRYSNSLTNRSELMTVLPFVILTTILIISIVKSSLALSLGLVGALSIVRFRTPIKEPEELAYLFLSIAIGLGLGANQLLATIISTLIILILMIFFMKNKNLNNGTSDTYINISGVVDNNLIEGLIKNITDKILILANRISLKRYIINEDKVNITFYVSQLNPSLVDAFINDIKKNYPKLTVTLLDQRNLPAL